MKSFGHCTVKDWQFGEFLDWRNMIRKSLTPANIDRLQQVLTEDDVEDDTESDSDLSSTWSVSTRASCSCHCKCKAHSRPRRVRRKTRNTNMNTERSTFSERSSNFHVKTGLSTSTSLSLRSLTRTSLTFPYQPHYSRDKIRLITLEDHIQRHDFSVHGNRECSVCRNILENESEEDFEIPSSSASPTSLSLYTDRSSSSLSSEPVTQKYDRRTKGDEKLADIEYLVDVPKAGGKAGAREKVAACDHRLQRKHGGCRVCYECSICKGRFRETFQSKYFCL